MNFSTILRRRILRIRRSDDHSIRFYCSPNTSGMRVASTPKATMGDVVMKHLLPKNREWSPRFVSQRNLRDGHLQGFEFLELDCSLIRLRTRWRNFRGEALSKLDAKGECVPPGCASAGFLSSKEEPPRAHRTKDPTVWRSSS